MTRDVDQDLTCFSVVRRRRGRRQQKEQERKAGLVIQLLATVFFYKNVEAQINPKF